MFIIHYGNNDDKILESYFKRAYQIYKSAKETNNLNNNYFDENMKILKDEKLKEISCENTSDIIKKWQDFFCNTFKKNIDFYENIDKYIKIYINGERILLKE